MAQMEYYKKYFKCPFYEGNSKHGVDCEVGKLRFDSKYTAITFMDTYCLEKWEECTIARALVAEEERAEREREYEQKNKNKS